MNWAECRVTLEVTVRKLFCDNQGCQRRIFTERLPQLTSPWARRTHRMTRQIQDTGVALGGAAAVKLMQKQGYSFSRDTILRSLARLPLPPVGAFKQLGVDDFAFAKRHRYGTILVDLEQQRPIALLKDREVDTLAQWLEQHPGIEILSRDRSVTYKNAMNQGAPSAIQVADRFHLLQNLTQVLEQALHSHGAILKAVDTEQRLAESPEGTVVVLAKQVSTSVDAQQRTQARRAKRLKAYQQVGQLHQRGWSLKAIASKVGLSTRTVQRYLLTPSFPERQGRSDKGRSLLNPYKAYLLGQYNQGHRQVIPILFLSATDRERKSPGK